MPMMHVDNSHSPSTEIRTDLVLKGLTNMPVSDQDGTNRSAPGYSNGKQYTRDGKKERTGNPAVIKDPVYQAYEQASESVTSPASRSGTR